MTSSSQLALKLLSGSLQLLTVRAEGLHAKRRCSTRATHEHSRVQPSVFKSISKEQDRATSHYKEVGSAHFVGESSADIKTRNRCKSDRSDQRAARGLNNSRYDYAVLQPGLP
jgi:hypothetical protein